MNLAEFSPITLRAANQSDISFLNELRRASMWEVVTKLYPWIEEEQQERVLTHFESARIICKEERDIGLLKVVYSPQQVHLYQIQLLPEWQGRGIGCMLISNLQQEACSSGLPVLLNVFCTNSAIKLYTRLGFRIYEEEGVFYKMIWYPAKGMTNQDGLSGNCEITK